MLVYKIFLHAIILLSHLVDQILKAVFIFDFKTSLFPFEQSLYCLKYYMSDMAVYFVFYGHGDSLLVDQVMYYLKMCCHSRFSPSFHETIFPLTPRQIIISLIQIAPEMFASTCSGVMLTMGKFWGKRDHSVALSGLLWINCTLKLKVFLERILFNFTFLMCCLIVVCLILTMLFSTRREHLHQNCPSCKQCLNDKLYCCKL